MQFREVIYNIISTQFGPEVIGENLGRKKKEKYDVSEKNLHPSIFLIAYSSRVQWDWNTADIGQVVECILDKMTAHEKANTKT